MKINDVDDLLMEIFGVPEDALAEAAAWLEITEMFEQAIMTANDILVIDTETDFYQNCQPYIQICYEDDGAMTVEAVSNQFLNPGLSPDAQNTLGELGWQLSREEGLPNYFQFLRAEDVTPVQVAQLIAKTFRSVYGLKTTDSIKIRSFKGTSFDEE